MSTGEQTRLGATPGVTITRCPQHHLPDVTVSEVRGRTIAACGCATDGNFSPEVAVGGTSATDHPTSPWGSSDAGDERRGDVQPVPLPHAMPHHVAGDVAEALRLAARSRGGRCNHSHLQLCTRS